MAVIEPSKAFQQFNVVSQLPVLRQLGLMVGLAASIALGVGIIFWAQEPVYKPLYGNLSEMDASQVINQLEQSNTPFKYDAASGVISVAAEDIHEVRIRMASSGLPNSSDRGFSMLYQDQGIGTSAFMESARFNQALAEELQRSIASLDIISGARVHLAIPPKSAFIRNRSEANASVVVNLAQGRNLSEEQVAGIVYLVASSVPDLDPDNVTLIDQRGRLLSGQGGSSEMQMSNEQLRYGQQIEANLSERVNNLLLPLFGSDNVRVEVTANINHTAEERTVEQYGQLPPVLRSEQVSEEITPQADAAGVPGALAINQQVQDAAADDPVDPANADAQPDARTSRRSTRNYEIDRTISHVKETGGRIDRLSVAVVLNHIEEVVPGAEGEEPTVTVIPVPPEQIANIEQIVREAVGFDAARGDTVSVTTAKFQPVLPPEPIETSFLDSLSDYTGAFKMLLGFLGLLALIFGVLRPLLRSLIDASAKAVEASAQPRYVTPEGVPFEGGPAQAGMIGQDGQPMALPPQTYEQQLGRARTVVQEDPERAAGVLKEWVAADGR
jgi:flagellar M-ring protein FliF